jgi:hypothetical protein
MPIAAIGQRRIAAPGVGHHRGPGLDRRLDKAAQRSCRTIRHNFHPKTRGEGRGVHDQSLVIAAVEVRQRKPENDESWVGGRVLQSRRNRFSLL